METVKDLKERLGDSLCDYCPYTRGETQRSRISTCEGDWCDNALQEYCDENGLEIVGDNVISETDLLKDAIKHCKDVEKSCNGNACGLEHHRLRGWLAELLNIKLREEYDEETIQVQTLSGSSYNLTRNEIWALYKPTEKNPYVDIQLPDECEDCTNCHIRVDSKEYDRIKAFLMKKLERYEMVDD